MHLKDNRSSQASRPEESDEPFALQCALHHPVRSDKEAELRIELSAAEVELLYNDMRDDMGLYRIMDEQRTGAFTERLRTATPSSCGTSVWESQGRISIREWEETRGHPVSLQMPSTSSSGLFTAGSFPIRAFSQPAPNGKRGQCEPTNPEFNHLHGSPLRTHRAA